MKKIELIVTQCIDDIKAGNATLQSCLDRYPGIREELEPLLKLALSIRATREAQPSREFKARARSELMGHIQAPRKSRPEREKAGMGWFHGWARAVSVTAAVIAALVVSGTATAFASQTSLPGDTLYSVKLGTEQVQRVFTFSDEASVTLELDFASERLDELEALARQSSGDDAGEPLAVVPVYPMSVITAGERLLSAAYVPATPEKLSAAVEGYEKNIERAINAASRAENGEKLREQVALAIPGHMARLDTIEDASSGEALEIVVQCRGKAVDGQIQALEKLAEVNPDRAAEINLQTIEARLQRMEQQAAKGNDKGAENSLQEYEKLRRFGEGISGHGGSNNPPGGHHNGVTEQTPSQGKGTDGNR